MLTPSPSWVCPHGSWLMTSNANSSPAQVVITFTKLPISVVQSLLTHFSSPLPNSPDSQFPSTNKPYLLILLQVDSTMTISLIRSPTLLLKWSVSKGLIERVSFLVFWRIYIFIVNILYMGQGMDESSHFVHMHIQFFQYHLLKDYPSFTELTLHHHRKSVVPIWASLILGCLVGPVIYQSVKIPGLL